MVKHRGSEERKTNCPAPEPSSSISSTIASISSSVTFTPRLCKKRYASSSLFECFPYPMRASRACLGKMMAFWHDCKWKEHRFLTCMISISSEPSISPEPSSSYLQENAPLFGVLFPYVSPGQSGQMFGVFSKHKIALTAKRPKSVFVVSHLLKMFCR